MAADMETGMDRNRMRALLIRSKQEPVKCAVGVGNNKNLALLMLASHGSGTQLQADLRNEFPGASDIRFGTALVDTDDDPTLVKFMLNRPVTGMARRLIRTLKGTGFHKVQILLADGAPVEVAQEDGTEPGPAAADPIGAPAPPQAAPQPDAPALAQALTALARRIAEVTDPGRKGRLAELAREADANIKKGNVVAAVAGIETLRRALQAGPPASGSTGATERQSTPPASEAAAKSDTASLVAALTALTRRIGEVTDPARKGALTGLARDAGASIKAGDLTKATAGIASLQRALEAAAASRGPGTPPPAAERVTGAARRPVRKPPSAYVSVTGREIWRTARETVNRQIGTLTRRLVSMPDAEMQRIATFGLTGATGKLSVGLLAALSDVDGVPPERQAAARDKARRVIAEFQAFLDQNELIRLLDSNPFNEPVTIRATLGAALTKIDQALSA